MLYLLNTNSDGNKAVKDGKEAEAMQPKCFINLDGQ